MKPQVTGIDILRWIGVLPVAVLGYFLIQILVAVMMGFFGDWSDRWIQLANSIAGPYYFVLVGALVAPRHNLIVAIVLAVIFGIFTGSVVTMTFFYKTEEYPQWWIIATSIASLVAIIVACVKAKEFEDEEAPAT